MPTETNWSGSFGMLTEAKHNGTETELMVFLDSADESEAGSTPKALDSESGTAVSCSGDENEKHD